MDMGGRRTNEWAAVAAARAAVVGGFKGTANLLPRKCTASRPSAPPTLLHPRARRRGKRLRIADRRAWQEHHVAGRHRPTSKRPWKTAVDVAGPELGGVRIDSGDLAFLAQRVRNQKLDALGATNTKITVTNDLDEYALASGRPLRSIPMVWVPCSRHRLGRPDLRDIYKLTERENSAYKAAGRQEVKGQGHRSGPQARLPLLRILAGRLRTRHLRLRRQARRIPAGRRLEGNLLVDYVTNGENHSEHQGHDAIVNAHNYRAQALAELPIGAHSR